MSRVLTLGEGLGVLRSDESLAQAPALGVGVGGAELNVAIGLARLGAAVTWLGRVGPDGLGRRVVRELRAEGVDVVAPVDAAATGLLLKDRDGLGRTVVTYHRAGSAGSRVAPDDLSRVDWTDVGVLHVTGVTPALSDSAAAAVDAAVERARGLGVRVSYDVNHRSRLWPAARAVPVHRRLAASSDLLFAGLDEAHLLLGRSDLDGADAARALLDLGPAEAVVKLGAAGAVHAAASGVTPVDAQPVPNPVDTVGAGDAFVAGYLAELLRDADVATRLRTAAAAGAAACRHAGDWEGAIRLDELAGQVGDPVLR